MKTNTIKKYKWYIFCAIAVVLIMSIGLSFCAWDNNSIKNLSIDGGVSDYKPYSLVVDSNNNLVADVGDIVTFGKYYQNSTDDSKTPLRWIVVHEENKQLTLLAESVVTFGSFYGRYYFAGEEDIWVSENESELISYPNFNESTVSQWLNSDYSARYDGGTAFSVNASKLGMKGFMKEAFSPTEEDYIIPKTFTNMKGLNKDSPQKTVTYAPATQKVWIPSWSEIFGDAKVEVLEDFEWEGMDVEDGTPNSRFSYFSDVVPNKNHLDHLPNKKLLANCTAFASTPSKSNYTIAGDNSSFRNAQMITLGSIAPAHWMLRSSIPTSSYVFRIRNDAEVVHALTYYGERGVRPTVCIPA